MPDQSHNTLHIRTPVRKCLDLALYWEGAGWGTLRTNLLFVMQLHQWETILRLWMKYERPLRLSLSTLKNKAISPACIQDLFLLVVSQTSWQQMRVGMQMDYCIESFAFRQLFLHHDQPKQCPHWGSPNSSIQLCFILPSLINKIPRYLKSSTWGINSPQPGGSIAWPEVMVLKYFIIKQKTESRVKLIWASFRQTVNDVICCCIARSREICQENDSQLLPHQIGVQNISNFSLQNNYWALAIFMLANVI